MKNLNKKTNLEYHMKWLDFYIKFKDNINNYSELITQSLFFILYFISVFIWVFQSQTSFKPLYIISLSVIGFLPILFEIFYFLISEQHKKKKYNEIKSIFSVIYSFTIFVFNLLIIFGVFSEDNISYFYAVNFLILMTLYKVQVEVSLVKGYKRLIFNIILVIALFLLVVPIAIIEFIRDPNDALFSFLPILIGIVYYLIRNR